MKKFVCGFVLGGLLFTSVPGFAQGLYKTISVKENSINLFINGNRINENNYIINNTTFVPLRAVSEALGQKVTWDGKTNSVKIGEGSSNSDENLSLAEKYKSISDNSKLIKAYRNEKSEYCEEWEVDTNTMLLLIKLTREEKKDFFRTKITELQTKTKANAYWYSIRDKDNTWFYSGTWNSATGFLLI